MWFWQSLANDFFFREDVFSLNIDVDSGLNYSLRIWQLIDFFLCVSEQKAKQFLDTEF